jgi:hypothetical protein
MEDPHETDIQRLWAKYEDIAMHFNDLLMRLRTQSLAGVAALSALVGIFSREGIANVRLDWVVAQAIFAAMFGFWIAIWCLDMVYYNRLLSGAVRAIIELEKKTKPDVPFSGEINMSTTIEAQFKMDVLDLQKGGYKGVVAFYAIVLAVIVIGFIFAGYMRATH